MGEKRMSNKFLRICNGLNDKGKLISMTQLDDTLLKLNKNTDSYMSLFHYDETAKAKFEETGSITGIVNVTSPLLFADFDSADDVSLALEDAREYSKRLLKAGFTEDSIQCFTSGNKGFHVAVELKETLTPSEMKNIVLNIGEGLPTLDKQIYNASRIVRIPLTKHQKSGLYKFPLTFNDLNTMTMDDIKEASKDSLEYKDIKGAWKVTELPEKLKELKSKTPVLKAEVVATMSNLVVDWTKKPDHMLHTNFLFQEGMYDAGERTRALLIYAARCKALGMDETDTYYKLKASADKQARRTGQERKSKQELWNIIKQVFSPTWTGGTFDDNTEPVLVKMKALIPDESSYAMARRDIITIQEVNKLFHEFASNIEKNRIKVGIKELDDSLDMLIGRVYILAGSPGSGKSSLLFQIFENLCKQFMRSIFFTFDMPVQDCYQKIIQREFNLTAKQVYEQYAIEERREEFARVISEKYGQIIFVNSSGMTVENMRDRIIQAEKQFGEIKVVAVDYMTLARSDKADSNEHSKAVIQGLKSIANDLRKCVISLNQPNKANQRINEPLSGYGGIQGSSAVQELANAILWIYRPGASASTFENDKYYTIECMKNRHGGLFSTDLSWNGVTGTVRSMTPVEKMKLEQFRQEQKEKKKEERSNDW